MRNWSTGVDTAAFIANLSVGLGSLVKQGYKTGTATAAELAKINAEVGRGAAINAVKGPTEAYAGTLTITGNESLAGAITKTLLISYSQMTSPSYWANFAVKKATGQTPLETIQEAEREVKRQNKAMLRQLQKRIDEQRRAR